MRTVSVEIFDEKSLTDDQRIAYAKISVPQSVFEVRFRVIDACSAWSCSNEFGTTLKLFYCSLEFEPSRMHLGDD